MRKEPQILVVEDEDELRNAVGGVLEEAGYRVLSAGNGRDALQVLINGDLTPDLILLDLRMPVMDGWEFARVVRCYRRFASVPIIVISTPSPGPRWHPKVDGVLAKPFTPRALVTEVEKHAPLDHSTAPG
jgi:CheY-like chemotaxis protein